MLVTTRPRRLTSGRFTNNAAVGDADFRRQSVQPEPDIQMRILEASDGVFSPKARTLRHSQTSAIERNDSPPKVEGGQPTSPPDKRRLRDDLSSLNARVDRWAARFAPPACVDWVDDRTGRVILRQLGSNFDHRAVGMIGFSDGGWWRFPVRGEWIDRAVMTAVDASGLAQVRYRVRRYPSKLFTLDTPLHLPTIEIAVAPQSSLRPDRLLAIALSAPWLRGYFDRPGGGG